mmetsp:Transcript_1655/g.3624  ORF Transcript_1655/g.3624 Transcript_1655/m.3624 type:complete len:247 (+) Transcript_1655:171-911(+)|eukprot:CAMPEP_0206453902 /NCGR_PEP_ID=MMETSP0324_2-20121206/20824_1 /ASSEMBLY_ACC=CAM_ASM_000836 /TAXON_ID=2866 /ORGANISM="Crypthecodinium cohnii, Strain Seligo" /LENGTH=246 /DNA_ID=CAMNT_0053924285 /DNA_START=135 /DNA_END=875 /DNA_ORIENTATION=+
MSLRGDFQGGSAGTQMLSDSGNIAIEKLLKWNWAFFGGAAIVFSTAIGTALHWVGHPTFAPGTFFCEIFLMIFGLIMLILDTPVPHLNNHKHVRFARFQIYKYTLFLTRFMGRGAWYMFLGTVVFATLYDTGINLILGGLFTAYLELLGAVALAKGFLMSHKLNRVRENILGSGLSAERYLASNQKALSIDQFAILVKSATQEVELFTRDELEYVISAMSFTPFNDGHVSLEELQYWLAPGPAMMV